MFLNGEPNFARFNPPLPLEAEGEITPEIAPILNSSLLKKPVILSMGFNMKNKNQAVKITNVSKKITGDISKWGSIQEADDHENEKLMLQVASKGKGKSSASIPAPVINNIINLQSGVTNSATNESNSSDTDNSVILSRKNSITTNTSGPPGIPVMADHSNSSSSTHNLSAPSVASIPVVRSVPSLSSSAAASGSAAQSNAPVACLLCRRQFATPEQLTRHERESKLHKENMMLAVAAASDEVARQLAAFSTPSAPTPLPLPSVAMPPPSLPPPSQSFQSFQPPPSASSGSEYGTQGGEYHTEGGGRKESGHSNSTSSSFSSEYRDRALERRATHQQPPLSGVQHREGYRERDRDRERDSETDRNQYVQKSEIDSKNISPLDDHNNPGSQMLRKMGWNDGQGLGRGGTGAEESVGVKLSDDSSIGGRRVAGVGVNAGSIPQINYSSNGREYKDSLLRAAKARYDQVSKE